MKNIIISSPLSVFVSRGNIPKRDFSKLSYRSLLLKISIILFVISQFFISESSAQNFFPLKVGNIYQVKDDWWWVGQGGTGDSGIDYYKLIAVRDTVINGETYFSLLCNHGLQPLKNDYLYRYDSLQQKLFIRMPGDTTTRLAVDFNLPAGTIYTSYITGAEVQFSSEGTFSQVVLGDTHLVYSMNHSAIPRHLYQFANDVGIIKYNYYYGTYGYASSHEQSTISAIIDSVMYNPLILAVDTLYPIQDRPVDTFPFLLTIVYSASYKELIDSFYISVEHIRADTLVQTKHYDVDWWNPHLTLSLAGLLAGDKVKLQAIITDTSIFLNNAHYPNTGWVVINVLPPILNVENTNQPLEFGLAQNYPNPFNPTTTIRYQIPEPTFVIIKIYDILGNEIETLVKEEKIAGSYEIEFDGSALTSGIYYCRITAGNFAQTKKMILLK
jgi:hypothetical protein